MALLPRLKGLKGRSGFRGELGIKIHRGKRPGAWQKFKDWLSTVRTK